MQKKRRTVRSTCTICAHPARHEIEMLRVSGCSLDAVAAKFPDVQRDALWRHMSRHVTVEQRGLYFADAPMAELAERAVKEGGSLLNYLALVRSATMQQLMLAASVNDGHRVAVLAGRAVEVLREIGKLTGEISRIGTLNVTNNTAVFVNSPAFAKLEEMLIDRLRAYPDALRAVVDGLRDLEATRRRPGRFGRAGGPPRGARFQCSGLMGRDSAASPTRWRPTGG
jgi:hypothetical protein